MGWSWHSCELRLSRVGGTFHLSRVNEDKLANRCSYIATDINKDVRTKPENKANFDFLTSRIPMGKWGDPDDFKGVAVFMASDASSYMSGENIVIDGGYMAR